MSSGPGEAATTPSIGDFGEGKIVDPRLPGLEAYALVGYGRSGVVLRALQPRLRLHVAVKLLLPASGDDLTRVERGLRRVRGLPTHPGILSLDESGTTLGGLPYVIMEYMGGGSLAPLLTRRGRLPWARAVDLVARVADAADHAHRGGLLHCNIKPGNILLSGIGVPRLADFWIDASFAETPGAAAAEAASIEHTAPEVLDGGPPTIAADLYSLASTLLALLGGHSPADHDAGEPAQVLTAREGAEPVPGMTGREVPAVVRKVLEQALAPDPATRPAGAAEFAYLLRRAARSALGARGAVPRAPVLAGTTVDATAPEAADTGGAVDDSAVAEVDADGVAPGGGAVDEGAVGEVAADEAAVDETPGGETPAREGSAREAAVEESFPAGPVPGEAAVVGAVVAEATTGAVLETATTPARRTGPRFPGSAREPARRPPKRVFGRVLRWDPTLWGAILWRRARRFDRTLWGAVALILVSLALIGLAVMAWSGIGPFAASPAAAISVITTTTTAPPDTTTTPPSSTTSTPTATTAPPTTTTTEPPTTTTAAPPTTTTTAPPTTTTTAPPTTTAVAVVVRVSPGSAPRGALFEATAGGLTPNGPATATISLPGGGLYSLTPTSADGGGNASWSFSTGDQDLVGVYSVTVVDDTSDRRGFGSFRIT